MVVLVAFGSIEEYVLSSIEKPASTAIPYGYTVLAGFLHRCVLFFLVGIVLYFGWIQNTMKEVNQY